MKFFQKVARQNSIEVFEFSDIERIKEYQRNLINTLIYEPPKSDKRGSKGEKSDNNRGLLVAAIHEEIKNIERWLKTATEEYILNNNRKAGL